MQHLPLHDGSELIPVHQDATLIAVGAQAAGVVAVGAFTFIVALAAWYVIKMAAGLRVSTEEEIAGLDLGEHGVKAYPDFQGFLTK